MFSPSFHNSRGSNFTLIRIRVQKSNPRWRLRWDRWWFYLQSSIKKPHFKRSPRFLFGVLTSNHNHIVNFWSIFFVNAFSHVSLKITRTRAKKEKEMSGFPFDPCFLIGWCGLTVDSSKVLLHTRVLHRVILRAVRLWHNRLKTESRSIISTATNSQQCTKFAS